MNKKLLITILLLLAVCLTGCACEHEWAEADCLNPQICTKCEEVGADALGHDWSAATCTDPQTCVRCGEIQGEALGHSFGDWSFGETDMTHTCSSCSTVESAELDRSLYLDTLLSGWWEFSFMFYGEEFYSAYQVSVPGDKLLFSQGNSFTGMVNQEYFTGTWEFQEYQYQDEDGKSLYYFSANGEDGRTLQMLFRRSAEEDLLYIFFADDTQVILSRNDAVASTISGSWGAETNGTMYSLTFHEDRTVTGNLGYSFEGTWQLLPLRDTGFSYFNDRRMCGIYISYLKDGEDCLLTASVYPPRTYGDDPVPEEFVADTLTVMLDNSNLNFEPMAQEEIDTQVKLMQEGPNMILGTWSSMYFRSFNTDPGNDTLALDYTITFLSDGTFTASVGKDLSGNWIYDESWGNGSLHRHSYYLYIQGDKYPYDMELEYTESSVPQLSIESRTTTPESHQILYLNKRSSQQDRMARSLIGSWISVYEESRSSGESDSGRINTMDYSFTFHEDGTFTGNDGEERSGTWVYERTRDETVQQYNLFFNGQTQEFASITLYDHSDSGDESTIDFCSQSAETGRRDIRLIQLTPEDVETANLGPTYILGTWASDSDGYSITFHEDGTFTANLDTTIQGTWSFRRFKPHSTYWYDFTFPGQFEYGDKTLYAHIDEEMVTFRIYHTQESNTFYQMYRSE